MNIEVLREEAACIANRNLNERVVRVLVSFDPDTSTLRVVYCIDGEPIDDDWEECELTFAELAAAFPEIIRGETHCCSIEQCTAEDGFIAYSKS